MAEGYPRKQLNWIFDKIGLQHSYRHREHAATVFLPCVQSAFADGEFVVQLTEPLSDPHLRELYGERDFHSSNVARQLRALAADPDPEIRTNMDALIKYAAHQMAYLDIEGISPLSEGASVHIDPDDRRVYFDEKLTSFQTRDQKPGPPLVVDYGPGIQGRMHIKQQIERIVNQRPPFRYFALGKGAFIKDFLFSYARLSLERYTPESVASQTFQAMWDKEILMVRDDGIAAATNAIVSTLRGRDTSTQIADLVIASGVHQTDRAELETGIENAHHLLKPRGRLLVRAPKDITDELPNAIPAADIIDMAYRAGFLPESTKIYHATDTHLAKPVERVAAVFRR